MVSWGGLYLLKRIHSEGNIHAWAVGEEGSQGGLLKQSKDQDLVPERAIEINQTEYF